MGKVAEPQPKPSESKIMIKSRIKKPAGLPPANVCSERPAGFGSSSPIASTLRCQRSRNSLRGDRGQIGLDPGTQTFRILFLNTVFLKAVQGQKSENSWKRKLDHK